MVMGDPAYIERVLENLVSNCEKYSQPGGPIEIERLTERAESR